jgi:hypothetical protein
VEVELQAAFSNCQLHSIGVSQTGFAAAYYHDTWGQDTGETELCVVYYPWLPPSNRQYSWERGGSGHMDSSWKRYRRTITAMTSRFIVLDHSVVLDLANNCRPRTINATLASASFTVGDGVVPTETGHHPDVQLQIIAGAPIKILGSEPIRMPKIIARPRLA